jgi:hypothetical protein
MKRIREIEDEKKISECTFKPETNVKKNLRVSSRHLSVGSSEKQHKTGMNVKQGNYSSFNTGDRYIMQKGVKVAAIELDQAVEEDKIRK